MSINRWLISHNYRAAAPTRSRPFIIWRMAGSPCGIRVQQCESRTAINRHSYNLAKNSAHQALRRFIQQWPRSYNRCIYIKTVAESEGYFPSGTELATIPAYTLTSEAPNVHIRAIPNTRDADGNYVTPFTEQIVTDPSTGIATLVPVKEGGAYTIAGSANIVRLYGLDFHEDAHYTLEEVLNGITPFDASAGHKDKDAVVSMGSTAVFANADIDNFVQCRFTFWHEGIVELSGFGDLGTPALTTSTTLPSDLFGDGTGIPYDINVYPNAYEAMVGDVIAAASFAALFNTTATKTLLAGTGTLVDPSPSIDTTIQYEWVSTDPTKVSVNAAGDITILEAIDAADTPVYILVRAIDSYNQGD